MVETHIVQTLFFQKKNLESRVGTLVFLQSEVTQLEKWMVSVFLSTAVHVVHQPKRTQVIIDNSLEEKLYKPVLK